jgi:ABC-type sugar transport system ATPase subunit
MSYLKITNLHVKQGDFCLDIDSLEIKKGSFFGVLGKSGAGKSTFLNSICGLESLKDGKIILDGQDVTNLAPNKRDIAYVFQNSLLFEGLSVKENLEYILKAKGIKKENYSQLIDEALNDCEAIELKFSDIANLSGGEKQRVALSMALILKPKLLILDEPFSNLDTSLKVRMREFLKSLVKKHNITAIMVTHDKEDAFELFDEMILLEDGKIIQTGSPKEIYENPISIKCAKFFNLENILYGNIKNGYFKNEDLFLYVEQSDCKEVCMIVPFNAIKVDNKGILTSVIESKFIDGRWKIKLENNLIFYSNETVGHFVIINIDISKLVFLKDLV